MNTGHGEGLPSPGRRRAVAVPGVELGYRHLFEADVAELFETVLRVGPITELDDPDATGRGL
ncbi:hypothetical protein [Allokutzneria albata]|uniref:hypothetical protein n=1 Tax=Allokutzneria albata TaxID=211114 RepID=UPI0012DC1BAA|nr:hypothetical protein [Allokutzneria albata]